MANAKPIKRRIDKKTAEKTIRNMLNPENDRPSGTEGLRHRRLKHEPNFRHRISLHRKGANYSNTPIKRKKQMKKTSISETTQIILQNHLNDVMQLLEQVTPRHASLIAKQLMKTCMQGWTYNSTNDTYAYKNSAFTVPGDTFTLNEDTSLQANFLSFDYDWLYKLATQADIITESQAAAKTNVTEIDPTRMADLLTNVSKTLKDLDTDQVHRYILNRAQEENINTDILKQILQDQPAIWRLRNVTIKDMAVYIIVEVKYREDGTTTEDVTTKLLQITVTPADEVKEIEPDLDEPDLDEPNLDEPSKLGEPDLGEPDLGEPSKLDEPNLDEPEDEPDLDKPSELDDEIDKALKEI